MGFSVDSLIFPFQFGPVHQGFQIIPDPPPPGTFSGNQ